MKRICLNTCLLLLSMLIFFGCKELEITPSPDTRPPFILAGDTTAEGISYRTNLGSAYYYCVTCCDRTVSGSWDINGDFVSDIYYRASSSHPSPGGAPEAYVNTFEFRNNLEVAMDTAKIKMFGRGQEISAAAGLQWKKHYKIYRSYANGIIAFRFKKEDEYYYGWASIGVTGKTGFVRSFAYTNY